MLELRIVPAVGLAVGLLSFSARASGAAIELAPTQPLQPRLVVFEMFNEPG